MSTSTKARTMGTPVAGSKRMARWIILVLLLGAAAGFAYWGSAPGGNVLTTNISEPLDGATTAKVDINSGTGHLTVDKLAGGEQMLASGMLQYLENQGIPTHSVKTSNGQAALTLRRGDSGQAGFRFPWAACGGGAYEWQVQLNPNVASDITAHSDGGNVKLDLAGMAVTGLSADTGGGNIDVVLPDNASDLNAKVSTGAGNAVVLVPSGVAARIHATSGLGKVIVDPRFGKIDGDTYQSPDYEGAANKVEITVSSGAGNVSVNTK